MTDKQTSKRVNALPQDPLAWMDLPTQIAPPAPTVAETDNDTSADEIDDNTVAAAVEAEQTAVTNEPTMQNDEDGGFGFFANDEVEAEHKDSPVDDEEGGFGFFANENAEEDRSMETQSPADDEDGGFGFFANQPVPEGAIDLESAFTIKNVEEWYGRFSELLTTGEQIKLHAVDLTQIDGCGLQLLCGLFASAAEKGVVVEWVATSDRLRTSAGYFGISKQLNLDSPDKKAA